MAKNRKQRTGNNSNAFQTEFASDAGSNNNAGACGTAPANNNANRSANR